MKKRFTLVELLIVVAVIAILAGMIFPAFGQVRGRARPVACINNLKQSMIGMALYATDFNGFMPSKTSGKLFTQFLPTLKCLERSALICPASNPEKQGRSWSNFWASYGMWSIGYGYQDASNTAVFDKLGRFTYKVDMNSYGYNSTRMKKADETVVFFDTYETRGKHTGRPCYQFNPYGVCEGGAGVYLQHGGYANAGFADGHAGAMSVGDLRSSPMLFKYYVSGSQIWKGIGE